MKAGKPWLVVLVALVGGLIGGALATVIGAGNAFALRHAGHAKTIEADKFVLRGPDGGQRGALQVNDKGMAALSLSDEAGMTKAEMRVAADGGSSMGFYDSMGHKRVVVGESTKSSQAGVSIFSSEGRQVVALLSAPSGEVSLTLYDSKSGLARAGLGLAADGTPALVLFDQSGKDRAELHLNASGKPGLALADESGKSIAGLPMSNPAQ